MPTGLKSLAISFTLVGIFVFAMLFFGIQLASDNASNQSIADDASVGVFRTTLNSTFITYSDQINASESSFSNTEPTVGVLGLQLVSVSSIWKSIVTLPILIYRLTLGLIVEKIFGDINFFPVFTIMTALVVLVAVLYAWKWIRGGDPD